MQKFLFLFLILLSTGFMSQDIKKDSIFPEIKIAKWDTLKYRKYEDVFIVGIFQQHRFFSNEFKQEINRDMTGNDTANLSQHTYYAESNLQSGIVLNYDKFQISLSTRSKPPKENEGKGFTKTFNAGFNFGDNRWVSENYYRRFQGFYNRNTASFDTSFKQTGQYFLQPRLISSLFMSRLMYFTNYENFSFKSGFGCNYRQLKSAATWIVGGSYNVYTLRNDSSVFPVQARPLYNDYGALKGFKSYNFSLNFGGAGTLVLFKAWFVSAYFTVGPEQQWRNYNLGGNSRKLSYVSWSGTGRFSFGLNLKKFYLLFSSTNDYNLFNSRDIISFKSESITQNFTFGWRFQTGVPDFYRKFQKTRFYKLFS